MGKKIKHNTAVCPKCGSKNVYTMYGEGRCRNYILCKCAESGCETYWGFLACEEEAGLKYMIRENKTKWSYSAIIFADGVDVVALDKAVMYSQVHKIGEIGTGKDYMLCLFANNQKQAVEAMNKIEKSYWRFKEQEVANED